MNAANPARSRSAMHVPIRPNMIALWLALATLAAVVIAPPEAYGSGRMFLAIGSTFALLILAGDGRIPALYVAGGLTGLGALVMHSLLVSQDPSRSLTFLTMAWAYYCLFGVFAYSVDTPRRKLAGLLVLLATGVSLYGLYQNFFGFERLYNLVFYSGASEPVRVPTLNIIESERVFSTFALPGTLWGFLILTIPLHGMFWGGGIGRRLALVANVGLILAVTILTQSYGLIAGLAALGLAWFMTGKRRMAVKGLVLLTIPLGIIGATIYGSRIATHNPVSLRLQNWLSAWEMFVTHPWGSGLDTYAILYMSHQQLGANETQFAHNTAVQLLGELGVFALGGGLVAAWVVAGRWRWFLEGGPERRWLVLAVAVWCAHNMIDINFYFGSIGAVGVAVTGAMLWSPRTDSTPLPKPLVGVLTTIVLLTVIASAVVYLSGELYHRAQVELAELKMEEAADTLATAAMINPFDSSTMYEAGQTSLELYHKDHEPYRITDAERYFQRAIDLSPWKVGPHTGLALVYSTLDRTEEALDELTVSQRLSPANRQTSAIRRLIENRQVRLELERAAAVAPEQ